MRTIAVTRDLPDNVALDILTTGWDYDTDRIIGVALAQTDWTATRITGKTLLLCDHPDEVNVVEYLTFNGPKIVRFPSFVLLADELAAQLQGKHLVLHNAPYRLTFLENMLKHSDYHATFSQMCEEMTDIAELARQTNPKRNNSLEYLCRWYCQPCPQGPKSVGNIWHWPVAVSTIYYHLKRNLTHEFRPTHGPAARPAAA